MGNLKDKLKGFGLATLIALGIVGTGLIVPHAIQGLKELNEKIENSEYIKNIRKEKRPFDCVPGSDNSTFLLENVKEGIYDFNFYRDKNNDGIADTKGKGFYLYKNGRNIPKFTEEDVVLKVQMKTLIKELCGKYFPKKIEQKIK